MSEKIVELVNTWHGFEKTNPDASIEDFCRHYLLHNTSNKEKSTMFKEGEPIHKIIGRAFGRLSRIGLFYGKRLLADLDLNSIDEFSYLERVRIMGTPTKKELVELHVNEYSSGIEIIKRLIKMGLLDEFPDEEDRRLIRVKITKKGKKILEACYPNMQKLGNLMYGPLSDVEKEQFSKLITKLDHIHYSAYSLSKNKQLDEIRELIKTVK